MLKRWWAFPLACCLLPGYAFSVDCGANSLQTYMNLGAGGCTENGLTFSNFAYDGTATELTAIPAADIGVALDAMGNEYGLAFSSTWSVGKGQTLDSKITFDVDVINPQSKIVGESLILTNYNFTTDGEVLVTEDTGNANLQTVDWREAVTPSASANFAGVASDFVNLDVNVSAIFGSANLQDAATDFELTPEPSSLALAGSGLLGLLAFAHRKVKA
jgi:hypothetical protein